MYCSSRDFEALHHSPSIEVDTSPFQLGTLNIETGSEPSPDNEADDLLAVTQKRLGWLVSPIQRPRIFPQKLF